MQTGNLESNAVGSGARDNANKPRLDLIPLSALKDCADVFEFGAKKYAPNNWRKGMDWTVPLGCLLRHIMAWQDGEDLDPDSGLPHLGHAMCNLIMLSEYSRTYKAGDDRFRHSSLDHGDTYTATSDPRYMGPVRWTNFSDDLDLDLMAADGQKEDHPAPITDLSLYEISKLTHEDIWLAVRQLKQQIQELKGHDNE